MEKNQQGNIKVFSRFRPFNQAEIAKGAERNHRIAQGRQLAIRGLQEKEISFLYDAVFDMDSTQEEVFKKVGEPVLNNILEGFHGTIMAYGQTSSGKTHTMQGYDLSEKENRGIMPRMIERLFEAIEMSPESIEFKIKLSIFEIYMEKIMDLLDVSKKDLRIRENKGSSYVENLTEVYVSDRQEVFRLITYGQKNRSTCATNMNEHSSRSHLIFLLSVNQFNNLESSSKTSKLFMIDLAGSEKISKTGAEGKVLEEAKKINLSLTNLGKVIKVLAEHHDKAHVPYRDSKLTRILKDSFGGNSKTTLIVTCSPHVMHLPQTISTLRFGENAQKVKNKPKINRELTVQELQKIIEKMEAEHAQKQQRIALLEDYITNTLKAELPKDNQTLSKKGKGQEEEESEDLASESVVMHLSEETEQRIRSLEQQLQSMSVRLNAEVDKYLKLKKEYNQLHANLTEILTENIKLQEQLQDKKRRSLFNDKSITDNAYLIKLILGEIVQALGPEQEQVLLQHISSSHWYRKVMVDNMPCHDYWQQEKEEMNRQLQEILNESQALELEENKVKQNEESRRAKDNEKIMELEAKFDELLGEYNAMMSLQTSWKAECQLYERKVKKKEEMIDKLEKTLLQLQSQMDEMYLYEDNYNDDTMSVKSNRIIKPLKGGQMFH